MTELKSIKAFYWGLKPYNVSQTLQVDAWEKVFEGSSPGIILGGEILPTITQGIRARAEDICENPSFEIYKVTRGGETTLHSPGQLVIYPVINIKLLKLGVRDYVKTLLHVSRETFKSFGLETATSENPVGLFSNQGKIGFCGLQIKRGISQHGLSLNIRNDLGLFKSIVSCGLKQGNFDKLENYASEISVEAFFNRWVEKASLEGILQKNQNLATNLNPKDFSFEESFQPLV